MVGKSGENRNGRAAAPQRWRAAAPDTSSRSHVGEAGWTLAPDLTAWVLILAALAVVILGTLVGLAESSTIELGPRPVDALLLALPLLTLALGMSIQRPGSPANGRSATVRDLTLCERDAAAAGAPERHADEILDRIGHGFLVLDRAWNVTAINSAAERMLGTSRETILGRNAREAFAPAMDTPVRAVAQQAMREGLPSKVTFFYPPLDSWFDVRFYPSREGLSVFLHDVTEWVTVTEELRASEARYRTLVEQIPVVIYNLAADEHATRLYFSPYVANLTGYTAEEVLARTSYWLDWVHPADRERVAAIEAATTDGEPFLAEYRLLRKDGTYVWVHDESVAIWNDAGQISRWQGILMDITPLKQAEEARARLAAIVNSAEDAIYSCDLAVVITSWNRGAERLYGYTAEEVIGQSMAVLLPDRKIEGVLAKRVAAARAGEPSESYTSVRRRKDGSLVDVTISLFPIRDQDGTVMGLSSITRDITAWKQAEEQRQLALEAAQSANATKSQFLAMMSHELRTPLQAILGYAEFLLSNPASRLSAEERDDLGYIHQGGKRMLNMVNHLLDLSRLEAGRIEVDCQAVYLPEVVEQVRQDVAPQAGEKGLALRIDLPASLPPVAADPERLRQILLNLVGNAVKFTDSGSVSIVGATIGDSVRITVTDTGIGISPGELPHIFEAFRQADSRLTRRHSGAGLGLAIAHGLAELMEGQITVESQPGAGTTFTLTLPVFEPRAALTSGER